MKRVRGEDYDTLAQLDYDSINKPTIICTKKALIENSANYYKNLFESQLNHNYTFMIDQMEMKSKDGEIYAEFTYIYSKYEENTSMNMSSYYSDPTKPIVFPKIYTEFLDKMITQLVNLFSEGGFDVKKTLQPMDNGTINYRLMIIWGESAK